MQIYSATNSANFYFTSWLGWGYGRSNAPCVLSKTFFKPSKLIILYTILYIILHVWASSSTSSVLKNCASMRISCILIILNYFDMSFHRPYFDYFDMSCHGPFPTVCSKDLARVGAVGITSELCKMIESYCNQQEMANHTLKKHPIQGKGKQHVWQRRGEVPHHIFQHLRWPWKQCTISINFFLF